jgi:hypothetical protein
MRLRLLLYLLVPALIYGLGMLLIGSQLWTQRLVGAWLVLAVFAVEVLLRGFLHWLRVMRSGTD